MAEPWTKEDTDLLRELKNTMSATDIQRAYFPDRTPAAVKQKITKLYDGPPVQNTPWSDEDVALLKELKNKMSVSEIQRTYFPNRTHSAVKQRLTKLYDGPHVTTVPWSDEDKELVRSLKGTMTAREMQQTYFPSRTVHAVKTQMLKQKNGSEQTPHPWTDAERRILDETYATSTKKQLLELLPNHTAGSIECEARKRGLTAGPAHRDEKARIAKGYVTNISRLKSNTVGTSNKTGVNGVHFDTRNQKFIASIGFKRRVYHLGSFSTLEQAAAARAAALEALTPELDRIESEIPTRLKALAERAAKAAARAETNAANREK